MSPHLSVLRCVVQVHGTRVSTARQVWLGARERSRMQEAALRRACEALLSCQEDLRRLERAGPGTGSAMGGLSPGRMLAHLARVEVLRQKLSAHAAAEQAERQALETRRSDEAQSRLALAGQEQTLQKWRQLLQEQLRRVAQAIEDQAEEDVTEGMAGAAVVRQQEGADGPGP